MIITMDKSFNYDKNDEPPFRIMEDFIDQVQMPCMAKEPIGIIDDSQSGYYDPRWIKKSDSIKARDNFTCQLCHAFNPMMGEFVFVKQGDYETIHHYYWAGRNIYSIQVMGYCLDISFNFYPNFHLAMPRLNVHHKIYYRNRDLWDYPDDCLVTLCERCHRYVHSLNDIGIPVVEENADGHNILIGKTLPKPYQPKLDHTDLGTFQPLALVEENRWGTGLEGQNKLDYERAKMNNKPWYDYCLKLDEHVVYIYYFSSDNPNLNNHTREETKIVADFIIKDFIENILGFSKIKH